RLYPYYLLAKLYAEPAFYQADKFRAAAGAVLTKEPKVESSAIREMRTEIKKILEKK
ncbi:O-antigen ligase domain-containing protein, partial [Parabacteroides sp. N37]|nr:O-antigen ligase domain-containing protein [Parabacteroides hominis]MBC5635014.1 O-antigen ligase domain-containing protein [Parabacteroides hominis]